MEELTNVLNQFNSELQSANSLQDLENLRVSYLGKKGFVTNLMSKIREIEPENRKEYGQKINQIKTEIETALSYKKETLEAQKIANEIANEKKMDITMPTKSL